MSKQILNLAIVVIMLFGLIYILTGCANTPSNEELNQHAIKMLEEIYGEKFSLVSCNFNVDGDLFGTASITELILKNDKIPNKEIKFRYRYNSDTEDYEYISCNYNFIKYEEKIFEKLKFLDDIYIDYNYIVDAKSDDIENLSFEDYIKSNNSMHLYIFLSPTDNQMTKEKDFEEVRKTLEKNKLFISKINIMYVNDETIYNSLDVKNEEIYGDIRASGCIEGMLFLDNDYKLKINSKWIERKKVE